MKNLWEYVKLKMWSFKINFFCMGTLVIILRTTISILLALLLAQFLTGCAGTSTMQCDNYLGVEKDMCIKQVKMVQYQIDRGWRYNHGRIAR